MRSVLVWLMVLFSVNFVTLTPARSDPQPCRPAELFATDNTDDELALFELQASVTMTFNGVTVTGSTLVDGMFWSAERQQIISERARAFHLCVADTPNLHTAADAVRRQFAQQAVLTFDYLPENAEDTNAITVTVPDIDTARFRDAFGADSAAHHRLLGGSVTTGDHTLILVAGKDDLMIARRLVSAAGAKWNNATVAYGNREFVR